MSQSNIDPILNLAAASATHTTYSYTRWTPLGEFVSRGTFIACDDIVAEEYFADTFGIPCPCSEEAFSTFGRFEIRNEQGKVIFPVLRTPARKPVP